MDKKMNQILEEIAKQIYVFGLMSTATEYFLKISSLQIANKAWKWRKM